MPENTEATTPVPTKEERRKKRSTHELFNRIFEEMRLINEQFRAMSSDMLLMRSSLQQQGVELATFRQRCLQQLERKRCALGDDSGVSELPEDPEA